MKRKDIAPYNYLESMEKWERIISQIVERGNVQGICIKGRCGFCKEFEDASLKEECKQCPLFPRYCSNEPNRAIFWKLYDAIGDINKKDALRLAKIMLKQIKKYNPQPNIALENTSTEPEAKE